VAHSGVNKIFNKTHTIFISFLKILTYKNYKFETLIIPIIKEKIGLKIIWSGPARIYIMWSTSGVASTRRKVVNTAAWHNLAIILDKHPVGITLNANLTCCINFQNLTLDLIFLRARSSYLVTNNMLPHSIFRDLVIRLPQNVM
jgi:hypothetical protein